VRKELAPDRPRFWHPEFDHETRIVVADIDGVSVASIYVPNGGRDYRAKIGFLDALAAHASSARLDGRALLLCGDLNVARTSVRATRSCVRRSRQSWRPPGARGRERGAQRGLRGASRVEERIQVTPAHDGVMVQPRRGHPLLILAS
jgi:exonuclease III